MSSEVLAHLVKTEVHNVNGKANVIQLLGWQKYLFKKKIKNNVQFYFLSGNKL